MEEQGSFEELKDIIGCILTNSSIEWIKRENTNDFLMRGDDGAVQRLTISSGEKINCIITAKELYEDCLYHVQEQMEKQGKSIEGIIFAKEGILVIAQDFETAYLVQLPDCEVNNPETYELLISDYEEDI